MLLPGAVVFKIIKALLERAQALFEKHAGLVRTEILVSFSGLSCCVISLGVS